MTKIIRPVLLTLLLAIVPPSSALLLAAELEIRQGDRLCLVGNALGERMQHHNYWETLLHQRFGDQQLVVRNLCVPGDEPYLRIRSQNFGQPDDHLAYAKASVVLYFFGLNESFAGQAGLADFKSQMDRLVKETLANDYSGNGAPRVVLISPIAFEDTGDSHLPDGKTENEQLEQYTLALAEVAQANQVGFVDLFHPTKDLFEQTEERLTLNGAHLSDKGYSKLASILDGGLFGPDGASELNQDVRDEVADKNFHWWHRYRAVNGYSIYGQRGLAGYDGTYNNRDVMERERNIPAQ